MTVTNFLEWWAMFLLDAAIMVLGAVVIGACIGHVIHTMGRDRGEPRS